MAIAFLSLIHPILNPPNTDIGIIADLVDPKPHDVPAQFHHTLPNVYYYDPGFSLLNAGLPQSSWLDFPVPRFVRTNPFQLPRLLQVFDRPCNGSEILADSVCHFLPSNFAVFPNTGQNSLRSP